MSMADTENKCAISDNKRCRREVLVDNLKSPVVSL